MAEKADDWKDEIRKKLIAYFEGSGNLDDFTRVMWYLDQEDKAYQPYDDVPPVWKTLRAASGPSFQAYADRIASDTKTAEKDPVFRKMMGHLYSCMVRPTDDPMGCFYGLGLGDDVGSATAVGGSIGIVRAWSLISAASQAQILQVLRQLLPGGAICAVEQAAEVVNIAGGSVVMVGLAVTYLGYTAIRSIYRWWRGEISGRRCAKNVIDASVTVAAQVGGGMAGAAIGVLGGPVGALAGGVVGGIVSGAAANIACDLLTQWLFNIPKEEALENAYQFLGVHSKAPNGEVNTAFRQLALTYHPDKGGKGEDFLKLNSCMQLVKISRGEF